MLGQWLNDAGLELFEASQVFDKDGTHPATLCFRVEESNLEIWLIEKTQTSLLVLSDAQFKERCRLQSVTPVEFLKAFRESLIHRSTQYVRQGGKTEIIVTSVATGRLRLEIPVGEPDASVVRGLLLQFGKQHADLKRENHQLKVEVQDTEARAKAALATGSPTGFVAPDRHRPAKKKPKIAPGMSVVNPRQRAVKQPKGVVFGEEDEE